MSDKQRIMDDYNAKDCEQCSSDTVCCNCQNLAWYKLKEQLQTKEQECEELSFDNFDLKDQLTDLKFKYKTINDVAKSFEQKLQAERKQLDQLKAELKSAKELREYTYDCCKRAGEELAKNSFEWDGKEKNLVVQAMELNERYDQLKVENGGLKKCYKNNSALLDFEETNTTKLVNKVMKLEKTLTEIKEILLKTPIDSKEHCVNAKSVILQNISECEVNNET